jgi:integrase
MWYKCGTFTFHGNWIRTYKKGKNMATINFITRTVAKKKNSLVPVYVRLRAGRKVSLVCKADIFVKPENWSQETQHARQRADLHAFKTAKEQQTGRKNFNDNIDGLRTAIESALQDAHQEDLTFNWLKTVIDKHWHPEKYEVNLFSFIQTFIDGAETRLNTKTGRPVSYKMRREYQVTFDYLKELAAEENKVINFKDIDLDFYNRFTAFLQKKKKAVNTIGKKIQTLKIFLNAAKDEGINAFDTFKSRKFKAVSEEADTIALNEAELMQLYNADLSDKPGKERVRDLFLVGCWTGCRFSDISQITPENITGGFIRIKQYKTGTPVVIPLHPVVTAILNKYKGQLPKAISNQKFNVALKDVAKFAGIKEITHKAITKGGVNVSTAHPKHELVTTHTARRSFATNLYRSDFPTLSIMSITGHKTEKAFLQYIKVDKEEHAKKLQKHWKRRHLKVV